MLCYLAILPPKKISDQVMKIRKIYAGDGFSQPHITLIPPFRPNNGLGNLRKVLEKKVCPYQPFPIKLNGLGTFKASSKTRDGSVLFVNIRHDQKLTRLQAKFFDAIKDKLTDLTLKHPPIFHITILKRMNFAQINNALKDLGSAKFGDTFKVREVVIFAKEADEPWQIKERIKLKDV